MSQPGPPAAAVPPAPGALRVVLFGPPGAGKSSLLGALAQSARSQEHLLNGKLTDLSHGLDDLWKRLYVEHALRTAEEVAPYPVDFAPFSGDRKTAGGGEHFGAVLLDCDGRVANGLLARAEAPGAKDAEGPLAREVVRADTLVLAVDAAAPPARVDADFAAFDRFLRLLEEHRGDRTDPGDLPVFLVLTKCDLLAQPGDTAGAWMERIEERKREVGTRFREFLARSAGQGPPPFGRLDLHLWATAVKRPALANAPARDREPFGVAELFRQCLDEAGTYRTRTRQSGRRLVWTAGGVGGVAAALLALMVGLVATNRETPSGELRARVEELRGVEGATPAERLRGTPPELRRRLATFTAVRDDPRFASLPRGDRDYVGDRIAELEEYTAYYEKLQHAPRPGDVAGGEKLREVTDELTALAPPHAEWADTDAGRLHAERLAEAEALGRAVVRARAWYDDSVDKGRDLWAFARYLPTPEAPALNWRGWYDEAARLLDPGRSSPFSPNEPIPGTHLTYATALRFDRVVEARADWEAVKGKLRRVLDVAAALGLVGDAKGRPAVLVVPRPPDFPLDRARARLAELQAAYPRHAAEFVLAGLPDAVVPEVRQAARVNYEYLLEPAREAVLRQLRAGGGEEEAPARWQKVGDWLAAGPAELTAWRQLALVLARLNDADAADPVAALAAFLQKTAFPIEVQELTLEVPFRNPDVKPAAGADLAVYHPATVAEGPAIACAPAGEGERDDARRLTLYRFRPRERQRLTYHPGEALWATLPLREGRELTWTRSHSTAYQFERLLRPPRLHRSDEPTTEGTLAEGIELVVTPAGGVPRVPDLMPVVRPAR